MKLTYNNIEKEYNKEDLLISGKHYQMLCEFPSDIYEHLPTLKKYSEQCNTITEFGVRYACATWAFIEASPKKLLCYDINYDFFKPSEEIINEVCNLKNIDFKFILGDSLKVDIENTDLLFIDTLHTYNQLYLELNKHAENVNKWIILHDTISFGDRDEAIYEHASNIIKTETTKKVGLVQAVNDFLLNNSDWFIKEVYENNNGLTILERK